jgi:hypothetical protein
MPRNCTICASPDRTVIDDELAAGASLRSVAARFGTSKSALDRHRGEQHAAHGAEDRPDTAPAATGAPHSALVGEDGRGAMMPGTAPENATVAGQAAGHTAGYLGFSAGHERDGCPENEAGVWILNEATHGGPYGGDAAGAGPAPAVSAEAPGGDAAASRYPEGDGGFAGFAGPQRKGIRGPERQPRDASVSRFSEEAEYADSQRKRVCGDCGGPIEVYRGTNRFKLGTGFCAACGRRVRLYREPVRTALRVVSQARATGAQLRAMLGG